MRLMARKRLRRRDEVSIPSWIVTVPASMQRDYTPRPGSEHLLSNRAKAQQEDEDNGRKKKEN